MLVDLDTQERYVTQAGRDLISRTRPNSGREGDKIALQICGNPDNLERKLRTAGAGQPRVLLYHPLRP